MKQIYSINNISKIKINIKVPSIIFLKGDLGAGKTTLTKYILNNLLGIKEEVTSPTYTYYNKYQAKGVKIEKIIQNEKSNLDLENSKNIINIYHFDLYKLQNYDEFFAIAGEDILDNNSGIILIEWPELIEKYYKADLEIFLEKTEIKNERIIDIKEN